MLSRRALIITVIALVAAAALAVWLRQEKTPAPGPTRSCQPPPPCLNAKPPCLMPQPAEGWCPAL